MRRQTGRLARGGIDGLRALEIAAAVGESSRTGAQVELPSPGVARTPIEA